MIPIIFLAMSVNKTYSTAEISQPEMADIQRLEICLLILDSLLK